MAQNSLEEQSNFENNQNNKIKELKEFLVDLKDFGGFAFASNLVVGGLSNLDPEQKARRAIYLTDTKKKEERFKVKKQLQKWVDLLKVEGESVDLLKDAQKKQDNLSEIFNSNMIEILKKSRALEKSYHSLALFFANAGKTTLRNIEFYNAHYDDIVSLKSNVRDEIQEKFHDKFRTIDLRGSYSLLLIPGYLGDKSTIESWADICHQNKVTMITDYTDLTKYDDENIDKETKIGSKQDKKEFLTAIDSTNLSGTPSHFANAIVVVNEIVARDGYSEVGEKAPLLVGGAGALAGRMLSSNPSQPIAGVENGSLIGAKGVRTHLNIDDINIMHQKCMVPLAMYDNSVIAFGDQSLNNGEDIDFNKYSVARVYNFISKCLAHYFNKKTFGKWDSNSEKKVRKQIHDFLDSLKFDAKVIKDYRVEKLEQNRKNPDVIDFELSITPFYPARSFVYSINKLEDKTINEKRTIK